MPKTLVGPKDSSLPPKLWAGAPHSCCKYHYKHILCIINSSWISNHKMILFSSVAVRDSADRVVGENGTYEELIACSHEIAASTAQLVAASKVQTSEYSPVVKSCNHVVLLYEDCLFLCSTNMEKMTLRPRVWGWNTQLFAPINCIYLIAELLFRFCFIVTSCKRKGVYSWSLLSHFRHSMSCLQFHKRDTSPWIFSSLNSL